MNTTLLFVAILAALVVGMFISARLGRVALLAGLTVIIVLVLLNLAKIIGLVEKAQAISKALGL